jgi:EGF-like domain
VGYVFISRQSQLVATADSKRHVSVCMGDGNLVISFGFVYVCVWVCVLYFLVFFAVLVACINKPCKNGGTCSINADNPRSYNCHCPTGVAGRNCQGNLHEVLEDPDRNLHILKISNKSSLDV